MARTLAGWVGFGVALGLLSCGDEPSARTEELVEPDWTLTFLAPAHGSSLSSPVEYQLAISGPAVTRGEPLPFDIGFFANDQLVHRSRDTQGSFAVPPETTLLKVRGVDEEGDEVEKVLGDQIRIHVTSEPDAGG